MIHRFGNPAASVVLIQPVDARDLSMIESEIRTIRELTDMEFSLVAAEIEDWNRDLSPWEAPAVFGNDGFGGGATETLRSILKLTGDRDKIYILGGYSLAGLFALWAAYQTDVFSGIAAASPSMWFPGFLDFMKGRDCQCRSVYLSLGDKEEKTRNPVMATVGDRIREAYEYLHASGANAVLEWNKGNHFQELDLRTARAFAWVMNRIRMCF